MKFRNMASRFGAGVQAFVRTIKETPEILDQEEKGRIALVEPTPFEAALIRRERQQIGRGSFEFGLGSIRGVVFGGRFEECPQDMRKASVKMAAEIKSHCAVNCPTKDFSTPNVHEFRLALLKGALLLKQHGYLYVGCMGGQGRTGIYMAGLVKMMECDDHAPVWNCRVTMNGDPTVIPSSVLYVREHYLSHAVETREQEAFIATLEVEDLVTALRGL